MVYKATEVAEYVVRLSHDFGDTITHLKLQKILYYIQGTFLALKGQVAFSDEILAWKLGPAVYSVYSEYKQYGKNSIPPSNTGITIDETDQLFIAEIYMRYRDYTTSQLVSKTHSESPYISTTESDVISNDSIRDYFTSHVYHDADLFSDRPIVTELPKEWYDPSEDEEWSKYL